MSISTEMDAPLLALALAAQRTPDRALREMLLSTQQRLEELRLAVMQLEELACQPVRPVIVPPGWLAQRGAAAADPAGSVVDLSTFRAAREGGAVRL